MPALSKIVKLTKQQLDSLIAGNTVKDEEYDDNVIYLVERNEHLGISDDSEVSNENLNCMLLGTGTVPSSTSTTNTADLSISVADFDLIVFASGSSADNLYTVSVPSFLCANLYNSSHKLVIKRNSTYYTQVWFTDNNTAKVSGNSSGTLLIYGVNL